MTYIDLFGGAGGWSVGLEMAGWHGLGLYDWNASACKTSKGNFGFNVNQIDLSDKKSLDCFEVKPLVVVGSPPCQGFSNEGYKDPNDSRNNLVWRFFDIIEMLNPSVWVFENVPGFSKSYGGKFYKLLVGRLEKMGYKWGSWILNAADFGVPQFRKRFIAIGSKKFNPMPPIPDHSDSEDLLGNKKYVTLWDAISDLPSVKCGERQGIFKYEKPPSSNYQKMIRDGSCLIHNHTTQSHSKRVLEKIQSVKPGQSMEVFIGKYQENKVAYAGGYRRALKWTPSWTAYWTRGMTSIHPEQDRFLSPRECARIQSFPDKFIFYGTTIENYTQICNAVPPLMAKAIGIQLLSMLDKTYQKQNILINKKNIKCSAKKFKSV